MGYQHRLICTRRRCAATAWLTLLALLGGPLGCKHKRADVVEARRELLTPPKTQQNVEEQQRKQQVLDADNELIPSEQVVAGIVLPRGLTLYASSEHDWDWKAHHVRADALERYFATHLLGASVGRSQGGAVSFDGGHSKDNPNGPLVWVRILRLRGSSEESEVFIREAKPSRPRLSAAEAEAQIQAQRAHAE
jgi:hypothetical protein